MNELVDQERM